MQVQIYMEVIKDLLLPSAEQLQIREDVEGVFLSNVHEVEVCIPPQHAFDPGNEYLPCRH